MKKVTEEFLHFLWKNQKLTGVTLTDRSGNDVEVLNTGEHNHDAGPDFFNARVRINGTIWAGNVEIHINASDWIRHGHHEDTAYDSVILHVVYYDDCVIRSGNDRTIPAVVIRFPVLLWERYEGMMRHDSWVKCAEHLEKLTPLDIAQWTSALLVEKLQAACRRIALKSDQEFSHWDAVLHSEISRCFGLPVNPLPFEMLAQSAPYQLIMRHRDSQHSLEAVLLGQAGMLHTVLPEDTYMQGLKHEYLRLSPKIRDAHVDPHLWKYFRMRPASFPGLRIAQLAALVHQRYPLMEYLSAMPGLEEMRALFRVKAGDYWNTHYMPGRSSSDCNKLPGTGFIDTVIINGVIPFLFHYGTYMKKPAFRDFSISLLEQIPGETNSVTKKWAKFGITSANAFESQACLFLYRHYCRQERCLECQFGNTFILHEQEPL